MEDRQQFKAFIVKMHPDLSDLDIEVMFLRQYGLTQREIAAQVGISQRGVGKKLQKLRKKFNGRF